MDRNSVNWHGFWPASPTPFTKSGELDEAAFRKLLQQYLREGMHGILVNGTTGEWFSQTDAERRRLAEIAVEEIRGRVPVVVGITTFTAAHSIELGRHARSAGVDGVLSTPPPYAAPNADEVVAFYQTLSDNIDLPLVAYNWPRGTNVEINKPIALRIAQIEHVVAIKDSTSNRPQSLETLEAVVDKIRVFGGFMSPIGIAAMKAFGGDGTIGGGMLLGSAQPEFYNAIARDDLATARSIMARASALHGRLGNPDFSGKYGSPQSWLKAAMNMLGQPGGYPRPPLLPVEDPAKLAAIRAALEEAGLMRQAVAA